MPSFRNWTIGQLYGLISTCPYCMWVLAFLELVFWHFLYFAIAPGLFGGRGEMAMAVPCCHPFYGTACAIGLTWRPLTGSLFLSSFWCRLKPGPSGERGRKSSLLQDMLVTGRPTCTTGGRSSRELTGNDPKTDRSLLTHKDGRPFLAGSPRGIQVVGRGRRRHLLSVRQYAVLLSLRLSFCPGFLLGRAELSGLRFVHFYLFRGPEAFAYLVYLGAHKVSTRPP